MVAPFTAVSSGGMPPTPYLETPASVLDRPGGVLNEGAQWANGSTTCGKGFDAGLPQVGAGSLSFHGVSKMLVVADPPA